jgi:hypothetical protein
MFHGNAKGSGDGFQAGSDHGIELAKVSQTCFLTFWQVFFKINNADRRRF